MNHLQIAFCEDELLMAQRLKYMVEDYLKEKDIEADYHIFISGKELLESLAPLDILFLDIDMPIMNGITAGTEYRIKNHDCRIIMATAQEEIQKEVFDVTPFHYATKPFVKEEIQRCLEKAIESIQRLVGNRRVIVYKNRSMRIVREKQICYFKAEFGYLSVKIEGEKEYYRITSSLSKMVETVDQRMFAIASRQYMVNLDYVTDIDNKSDLILLQEETIKLSRGYKKTFSEKLEQYDLNYRR